MKKEKNIKKKVKETIDSSSSWEEDVQFNNTSSNKLDAEDKSLKMSYGTDGLLAGCRLMPNVVLKSPQKTMYVTCVVKN